MTGFWRFSLNRLADRRQSGRGLTSVQTGVPVADNQLEKWLSGSGLLI